MQKSLRLDWGIKAVSGALREIEISDLVVGQSLLSDIIDPAGRVLLKQGQVLEQRVVDRWLSYGFQKVLVPAEQPKPVVADSEAARLSRPYDPGLLEAVDATLSQSKNAIEQMIVDLTVHDEPKLGILESLLERIAQALKTDSDAVLARAQSEIDQPCLTRNERLMQRSSLMAALSSALAAQLNLDREDTMTIAMAAALHDVSLFEETLAMHLGEHPLPEEIEEAYRIHGDLSAELLGSCRQVSLQVRVIISQVHEQVDGSGFPKGLRSNVLSIHSRILNLVDAYLTLIDPSVNPSLVPADALAYLVHQTTRGAFDYQCMRGLLNALSIYPIGSNVLLNDNTSALVVRSSRSDPLRPIVRVDGPDQPWLDLRQSKLFIKQPNLNSRLPSRRRLRRSELDAVLWQVKQLGRRSP